MRNKYGYSIGENLQATFRVGVRCTDLKTVRPQIFDLGAKEKQNKEIIVEHPPTVKHFCTDEKKL